MIILYTLEHNILDVNKSIWTPFIYIVLKFIY